MIITINIDNTFTNYNEAIGEYFEQNPLTEGEGFAQGIGRAYAEGLLKSLKPAPNASEVLWNLNEQGHHIRFFVNRFILHGQNHKVIAHTTEWLDKHDLPYREIFFLTTNPKIHTNIHIDADPRIINLLQNQTTVIKYNTSQNEHVKSPLNVSNWKEVETLIKQLDQGN